LIVLLAGEKVEALVEPPEKSASEPAEETMLRVENIIPSSSA
jgi:hypothetical protein